MDLKSNEPFWLIKNGLLATYPSLKENIECEVLVVGGGITGSLIAHQMVGEGYDTVLIDKREVVHGSSSATTSLLQYEIDVPLYKLAQQIGLRGAQASYQACGKAIDTMERICKSIGSKAGFKRKNSLYFAAKKKDQHDLKRELQAREKAGFKVKWLSAKEIEKRFLLKGTFGGILSSQGASVDAYRLAYELLDYSAKRGLRIFDRTALESTRNYKDHVSVKLSSGLKIKARRVIYAVGYEAQSLFKEKFVDLKSTYAMVSEASPKEVKVLSTTLFWNTAEPYLYFRTTDDGRLLIGGGDTDFTDAKKRDAMLQKKQAVLKAQFQKLGPNYSFYTDFVWAGTFGETADGLPYIGTHPDFKHSYFVLGFGGNGITFSVAGMEMASLFMKNKDHELTPYFKFGRATAEQER